VTLNGQDEKRGGWGYWVLLKRIQIRKGGNLLKVTKDGCNGKGGEGGGKRGRNL